MNKYQKKQVVRRLLICIAIAAVAVIALSEIAFLFQGDRVDRGPETIELVIPAGTAELVAAGMVPPEIPEELVFVLGDVLRVVNQDEVDHQLGPTWVPPGGTSSLQLGEVEHVAVSCSFRPNEYLGIRVEEPTTIMTRLTALLFAVPPTAGILFVYSLAAFPLEPKQKTEDPDSSSKRDQESITDLPGSEAAADNPG